MRIPVVNFDQTGANQIVSTSNFDRDTHEGSRSYYKNQIDWIDVSYSWKLSPLLTIVVKYLARLGKKTDEDPIEALQKCLWYINEEIRRKRI